MSSSIKYLNTFILLVIALFSCEELDHSNASDPAFIPSPPTEINLEVLSDSEIRITWSDNSDYEIRYLIERNSGSGFHQVAEVEADLTNYTDDGLDYGISYVYRVAAYSANSNKSPWITSNATSTVFPAPSSLTATITNDLHIELTWVDNCSFEVGYILERDSGVGFEQIAQIEQNVTSFTDNDLDHFTYYTYRIMAFTSINLSEYSSDAMVHILGTLIDFDGNEYETVKIGEQVWMVENLKVTHYRNGDTIPHIVVDGDWDGLSSSAYCYYSNNVSNLETWGALYNWFAVDDSRSISPDGWHVPTDAEWETLYRYVNNNGYPGIEGQVLKSIDGWNSSGNGTDNFGFTGLPGGLRRSNDGGGYNWLGNRGYFWSATEYTSGPAGVGWYWLLRYDESDISRLYGSKRYGFSIRCIKD